MFKICAAGGGVHVFLCARYTNWATDCLLRVYFKKALESQL